MSLGSVLVLVLGVFCVPSVVLSQCTNTSAISASLDALLAEYAREEPPPDKPVNVTLALDLRQASLTDEGYLRILADLYLTWMDSRLSWNATEWGCDKVVVSAERVWTPDVELVTGSMRGEGLRARVAARGAVSWPRRLDLAAPARGDGYYWPSDDYTADFKFASREHDLDEMTLTINFNKTQWLTVVEMSAWQLRSVSAGVSRGGAWWGATRGAAGWRVAVRRRAGAAGAAARAALATVAALLAAAGALPACSRLALHVGAALISAISLFWSCSSSGLSSGVPLLSRLSAALCVLAGAAACGSALVTRTARRGATPPPLLKTVLTRASKFCTLASTQNGEACEASWSAAAQLLDYIIQSAIALALIVIACLAI